VDPDEHRDAAARLEADYLRGAVASDEYFELKLRLADAPVAPEAVPPVAPMAVLPVAPETVPPDVPEAVLPGVPEAPQFASWGRRAAAGLLDFGLLAALFAAVTVWSVTTEDPATGEISDNAALAVFFVFFVFPVLYGWLMIGRWGQTLGKMAVGEKVVRSEGERRVGYARALGRLASVSLLSLFVLPLLLAFLWPLWDRRKQTLYDKMADTVVVRVGSRSAPVV
jgi:uncharacterized RDD family membrane protein YckC